MKLIMCTKCGAARILEREVVRCRCGESQAVYLDERNAIYAGPCVPLGIDNATLVECVVGTHTQFNGFRIPANSRYFRRVDDELVKPRFAPPHKRVGNENRVFSKWPLSPHQK